MDQIPENTKDPGLLKKRKDLQRKKPTRNSTKKYWSEADFERLKTAPPARLYSKGPLPWRLLAYLLKVSPEVDRIRTAPASGPRGRPGAVDWAGPASPAEAPGIAHPQWEVCGVDAHVWGQLRYPGR